MLHRLLHVLEKSVQYSLKKAFWVHKIWILCHLSRICLRSENPAFFPLLSAEKTNILASFFLLFIIKVISKHKAGCVYTQYNFNKICLLLFRYSSSKLIWCWLWHYKFLMLFSRSMTTKGDNLLWNLMAPIIFQFKHGSQTSCFCCLHFE